MSQISTSVGRHTLIKAPSDLRISTDGSFAIAGIENFKPHEYLSVAPALKFRRSRELDVKMVAEIAQDMDLQISTEDSTGVASIRYFLEDLWVSDKLGWVNYDVVVANAKTQIEDYQEPADPADVLVCPKYEGNEVVYEPVSVGSVIAKGQVSNSGEEYYYLLESNRDDALKATHFFDEDDPKDSYFDAWSRRVDVVKRVFKVDTQLKSSHEFIDLSVGAMMEYFPYLDDLLQSTSALQNGLNKQLSETTDVRLMKALHKELVDLSAELASIKRSIVNLQGFASSKGYELVVKNEEKEVTYRGKKQKKQVFKGQLIQQYTYTSNWVEEYKVKRSRRKWYGSKKTWTEIVRKSKRAKDIDYRLITTPDENLNDYLKNYLKDEVSDLDPIVFEYEGTRLVAKDGRTIEEVLDLCELDPSFRRTCAVLLPTFNQTLFGDDVVAGYHIVRRPQRGKSLIGWPDYFVEESLSYKMRWLGCELGELVSSINLLPGEEREISIKTTRSSLREHEMKTSTNMETDSSSSLDTLTSIENEFQRENKSEKTKSWSAKASGSYGAFSGGASASGTSKQTSRQFAKTLNKVSSKAVSKMRRQTKQEVVARELTREEVENTSTASGTIVNPNVGRTLNVNFFTINNVYSAATFLDDVGFLYVSPFELIDGTGIRETFHFQKENVESFISQASLDAERTFRGSLRVSLAENPLSEIKFEEVVADFVVSFEAQLKKALTSAFNDYSSEDENSDAVSSLSVVGFEKQGSTVTKLAKSGVDIIDILRRITATDDPIEPTLLSSPSPALYAESGIGSNEALEAYAVDMRKLEVEEKLANVMRIGSDLSSRNVGLPESKIYWNASYNLLEDKLQITLGSSIEEGAWHVYVAGRNLGEVVSDGISSELNVDTALLNGVNSLRNNFPLVLVRAN